MYITIAGITAVLTEVYLLASSARELETGRHNTVPAYLLTALWIAMIAAGRKMEIEKLALYLLIHAAWYATNYRFPIWKAGYCDVLLLLSAIIPVCVRRERVSDLIFVEIILFQSALIMSYAIARIAKTAGSGKQKNGGGVPGVPGFTTVIVMLFIQGFIRGNVR